MKPKVSVIVPVYNCEKYIERCVNSLLNQSMKEIEIILVNDGSTDKCAQICQSFSNENKNIFTINQVNGGASKARSAGIKVATGDYIGFVDSDDWAHPEMFKKLYSIAMEKKTDIVQCSFLKTTNPNDNSICYNNSYQVKVTDSHEALRQLLCVSNVHNYNYLLWNKLFRKEIFDKFEYPVHVRRINDVPVIPRTFYHSRMIAYTNQPLMYYFERNDADNRSTMDTLMESKNDLILSHIEAYYDVASYFKKVDYVAYQEAMYLVTIWICSGMRVRRRSISLQNAMRSIILDNAVTDNRYIPVKLKTTYCLARTIYKLNRRKG